MKTEKQLAPRKLPKQERSRQTVEAILQAAAEVFADEGYASANTNRIAERAGVSIGSLYQFFPNKDAILSSLLERHLDEARTFMEEEIPRLLQSGMPLETMLDRAVDALMKLHERNPRLMWLLFRERPLPTEALALLDEAEESVARQLELFLRVHPDIDLPHPELSARVTFQVIELLVHWYGTLSTKMNVDRKTFAGEMVRLLRGYLRTSEV